LSAVRGVGEIISRNGANRIDDAQCDFGDNDYLNDGAGTDTRKIHTGLERTSMVSPDEIHWPG